MLCSYLIYIEDMFKIKLVMSDFAYNMLFVVNLQIWQMTMLFEYIHNQPSNMLLVNVLWSSMHETKFFVSTKILLYKAFFSLVYNIGLVI